MASSQPSRMRLLDATQKPWIELRDAGELRDVILFLDKTAHQVRLQEVAFAYLFVRTDVTTSARILQIIKWIGGCDYLLSLGVSTIVEITSDKCNIQKNLEVCGRIRREIAFVCKFEIPY